MAELRFTPTFDHVDYVDKLDRVDAVGFNNRFNAISSDLHTFAGVVTAAGAAIGGLTPPPPQTIRLTFAPMLLPISRQVHEGSTSWGADETGAAVVHDTFEPTPGITNLALPDQVRLTSLRVAGSVGRNGFGAGKGTFTLARTPLRLTLPLPDPEKVAVVTVADDLPATFDVQAAPAAGLDVIDGGTFRYLFTAVAEASASQLSIEMVQLTFTPI